MPEKIESRERQNLRLLSQTLTPLKRWFRTQLKLKMYDDDQPDERLIWSFPTINQWVTDDFEMETMPYMGGDHDYSHATIVKLPGGYHAVGEMGSGTITNNIVSAFQASVSF